MAAPARQGLLDLIPLDLIPLDLIPWDLTDPRSAGTARAARRPDTGAPWMDGVSRWSPHTYRRGARRTALRSGWGAFAAGSACGTSYRASVSHSSTGVP
nr:hypothetical protein [Saccharothrix yanglingensis]